MQFDHLRYRNPATSLSISNWHLAKGQHWAVFAAHSHCVSALVQLLSGDAEPDSGTIEARPARIACVSLALQQQLLEQEIAQDETDFQDHIDYGSTVEQLLAGFDLCETERDALLQQTDLLHLRQRHFRQLSTGETRRVMLARALAARPEMLVLDEPYSGLDRAHRQALTGLLNSCAEEMQLVIITSREDELPECISHVALFDQGTLTETMTREQWHDHPLMRQLQALSEQKSSAMFALMELQSAPHDYPEPLVAMKDVKVEYVDGLIFSQLNWQIRRGEHWQIRGPNGCGKSTLLGLIMGDHPQCYSNDVTVLGMKRGSGESIWDVKRHIGIVSSALHLQYRVGCSALEVLLSGFFDSIGLYEQPSKNQILLAQQWLEVLAMSELAKVSFKALDYGQQRLLLIGRALIKQPALLILDEPYQGLDYLNRKLVWFALNRIAAAGLSQLLYVTHHEDDALEAVDHYVDFLPADTGYRVHIHRR